MKKITALLIAAMLVMSVALTGCGGNTADEGKDSGNNDAQQTQENNEVQGNEEEEEEEKVMTYAEFTAAEIDSPVTIEAYVQGKQSWWDNKATIYTQNEEGAYFLYEMPCSEEDYAKLTVGTKIRVSGYKSEWSGEIEITDSTFTILDGSFVAQPKDITEFIGKDEIANYQNQLVSAKGLTVKDVSFKNEPGTDDIYVTTDYNGTEFSTCIEFYLTGSDTDVYKTVQALAVGDVIDVEGFLYWYNGPQIQITAAAKN